MTRSIILFIFFTFTLSACSPQELFSDSNNSGADQSGIESIDQAKALEDKLRLIQAKQESFPESTEFGLVQPDFEGVAFAFRNSYDLDNKSLVEVEAIMPDAENKFYEAWLISDNPEDKINLGALTYNGPEDYSLSHKSDEDLTRFSTIIITVETSADDIPEERVLIANFSSESDTTPPTKVVTPGAE